MSCRRKLYTSHPWQAVTATAVRVSPGAYFGAKRAAPGASLLLARRKHVKCPSRSTLPQMHVLPTASFLPPAFPCSHPELGRWRHGRWGILIEDRRHLRVRPIIPGRFGKGERVRNRHLEATLRDGAERRGRPWVHGRLPTAELGGMMLPILTKGVMVTFT